MRKIFLLLFTSCVLGAVAQNKSTVETWALINNYRQAKKVADMSKMLTRELPVHEEHGVAVIGVLAQVNDAFSREAAEAQGIRVTSRVANIVAMRVPLSQLEWLEQCPGVELFSVVHYASLEMDNTRVDTRTDSVQAGLGVPMAFNGEGVLIGITDWGFDYTHPNINADNHRRILRAWDHYKTSGPAPAGFNYGTEYSTYEQLIEAQGDTSGLYGYGTHGTHVAGICAGRGTGGHAVGQAPGAQLLLGSWKLDEATWMDQVAWMWSVAKEEGKRLVINGSWGMYTFSTLDGTSLLSRALNAWADSGIVFVTSGGNNGDNNYHIKRIFGVNDTVSSTAEWYSGSNAVGQALILWGEPGQPFEASVQLVRKNNINQIVATPFYSTLYTEPTKRQDIESMLITDVGDTIHYTVLIEAVNPLDQRPHILFNIDKNSNYRLDLRCTADSGTTVNIFNLNLVENHAGNTGCAFKSNGESGYVGGDNYYGIGEPACAEKTIAVAAHVGDRWRNNGEYLAGGLTSFSSVGPTLDGRNKPEISAPGSEVVSSISVWTDQNSYQAVYSSYYHSHRYIWSKMSGTSMSGPAVSGVVALMLQANPKLTVDQVREILFSTARNDEKTGPLRENDSVSIRWGYGKVDALKAVNAAYDLNSIEDAIENQARLIAYPNPTSNSITLTTGTNASCRMALYDICGRQVMSGTVCDQETLDLGDLPQGVYFVRVFDRTGVRTAKVVKQ